MQKSYGKGLANHIGPESCGNSGNNGTEALTGVCTGWVLSPEMKIISSVDGFQVHGKQYFIDRYGKECEDSAGSETPSMYRDILRGNREALHLTFTDCIRVRMENPKGVRSW